MAQVSDKWFHKYAWVLLFTAGLPFLIFGISALLFGVSLSSFPVGLPGGPDGVTALTGDTWDEILAGNPDAVTLLRGVSRVAGLAFLGFAIFTLTVSSLAYRRGERWSWFVMWTLPAFMFGLFMHELEGDFVQMPAFLLVLSLLGLILPYKRFFR